MSTSQAQLGFLQALEDDGSTMKSTILRIPLFEGLNAVGRDDLVDASKQVSRKHVAFMAASNGKFEVLVEGQNPIVIKSGSGERRLLPNTRASLVSGDVIEFLPGKLPYRLVIETAYIGLVGESSLDMQKAESTYDAAVHKSVSRSAAPRLQERATAATPQKRGLQVVVASNGEDDVTKKQRQQLLEDEALARALQEEEDRAATVSMQEKVSLSSEQHIGTSYASMNPTAATEEAFGVEYEAGCMSSSTFRLLRVKGLPQWANKGCVTVQDIVQGDVQVALLSNYMVDIDWLLGACPRLRSVPSVVVIHGESGGSLELLQASKPNTWSLHKPPLRLSYGTHHSKAMFLIYPTGVRVVVHTANLIYVDWNHKSQGLWMQDFPYKNEAAQDVQSPFENDLVEYLQALEWSGCTSVLPRLGEVRVNATFFRRFDFGSAMVRLVSSVPGYHQGRSLTKWGHLKLRTILQEQRFEKQFKGSPCVYQFSSLGSLDEKWLGELASSMQAGSTLENQQLGPGPVQIVWPTVEDIRWSLEGYAAGNAVPSPLRNVERAFLSKYWSRWQADHTGRSRAIPHIKTFVRYNDQNIAWCLLTSSNLSKAAWGSMVKNGSQLMIRSYELGVLFLPSLVGANSNAPSFSCTDSSSPPPRGLQYRVIDEHEREASHTKLVTLSWKDSNKTKARVDADIIVRLPLPYALPPVKYGLKDTPWSWDRQYRQPDVYGEGWPRSVRLYTKQA